MKPRPISTRRRGVVAALAASLAARGAHAQPAYPSRPLKLIVPYPPGGSTDILARAFAEAMGRALGQQVVVDNRPGAATNIGTEAAAHSPPDGYTVYFGTSALAQNPHFGPVPTVDVFRDLAPVSLVATMSFVVAANPALPIAGPAELVAAARARPGKLSISSASLEVTVKTLNHRAGIQLLHVPYKGGAQATSDAMAGHVDMVVALLPVLLPQLKAGKLKPIGLAAEKRSPAAPSIPTMAEGGVQGFSTPAWFALYVPPGTPEGFVARLNAAAVQAAAQQELVARMLDQGIEIQSSTPRELAERLRRDWDENAALARELK